jgi:hypothetical protein
VSDATDANDPISRARRMNDFVGTNTEGGAFESIYVALVRYRDEKVAGHEFFEPEHLDQALARFAALGGR